MRGLRRGFVCFVVAGGVLAAAPAARAQADESPDVQARDEFQAGRAAFSRGAFEEAVRRFEHAYELSGRAQLLYNIGTSYERLHRWAEARAAFQRYLTELPNAPDREEVTARLRVIEAEIHRPAVGDRGTFSGPPRVIVREVHDAPHPWRTVGFVTGGLALIGTGTAIVLGIVSSGFYNRLVEDCRAGSCPNQSVIDDLGLREGFINSLIVASSIGAAFSAASFIIDAVTTAPSASARTAPTRASGLTRDRAPLGSTPHWRLGVGPVRGPTEPGVMLHVSF